MGSGLDDRGWVVTLTLAQSATAVGAGIVASFLASGGTTPYAYSIVAGGAGGSINSATGVYTAPASAPANPAQAYDTVQVTDGASATATAKILVGTPLKLLWEILKTQLGLADDHIYLWDQKVMQPTDDGLYVAISVPSCRPFGNNTWHDSSGNQISEVSMSAAVDIDIISRSNAARDRKEDVLIALASDYCERQQVANSFQIAKLPAMGKFTNLSMIDGAAIPYRYKISFNMTYAVTKSSASPYFDNGFTPGVTVNV